MRKSSQGIVLKSMRNTAIYYVIILAPCIVLFLLARAERISSLWFIFLFSFYLIVYRSVTDYLRLLSKGVITKKDFWIILAPGSRITYFKALYLP